MAALAGVTTLTVTESIASESINQIVIPAPEAPSIWEAIGWVVPNASGHLHRWVSLDAGPDIVGSKVENDEFTPHNLTTGKAEATPATVGDYHLYSDETAAAGSAVSPDVALASIDRRVRKRIDRDMLALLGSAANTSDFTDQDLTVELWLDALSEFQAQYPTNSRIAFVASGAQIKHLRLAMVQGAGYAATGPLGQDLFDARRTQGYIGRFLEVELYLGDVPDADADNSIGGFISCAPAGSMVGGQWQPGSGLGAAFWWAPRGETQRAAERTATKLVVSSRFGCAITAQHNVRAVISSK